MFVSVSLMLWTAILGPILYVVYVIVAWSWDAYRRNLIISKFPSEPRHWLWGHLHLFPGPTEAGLEYLRSMTDKYPRTVSVWRGPWSPLLLVRHPQSLEVIVNTSGPNEAGLEYMRTLTEKYPRAMLVWRGPWSTIIVVRHPQTLKVIVNTSEPKPLGLGVYTFGIPWLGDGLLISGGKKWARNRKLLTPAFHFDILRPYMAVNNQSAEIMLGKLQEAADAGESMEIFNNISLLTLDIILRCAFSYDNDCQVRGEKHPYVHAVGELGDLWVTRSLQPWLYADFLYYLTANGRTFKKHCDFVHSVSEEIIAKRKETLNEEGAAAMKQGRYLDFLDILLTARDEEGTGLSDADIRAEVDTFMFEGHDTTASSISWMIYSMASNPECQQKVQQEIDSILDGRESDDVLWDDLPMFKYLTMAIKESMRLHCPVPFIERQTTQPLNIDGVTLPIGTVVGIQIYNLHHNPVVWEDPMEYRPNRFLPDAMAKMDNFAFIPFSAGPRNCIGQNFAMHEQKSVLARILHRFSFELDPSHPIEKKIGVVMKTKDGMRLRVKARR